MKKQRVLFFGTPEFSIPAFEVLFLSPLADLIEVVGVVTQPDKPVGRKQVLHQSDVKKVALRYGLPVYQPITLRRKKIAGEKFFQLFQALQIDLAIVIAYGKIIPVDYLQLPQHGFVNVHGSLLPLLRGASPIQAAIRQEFSLTGVTVMQMDAGMDTGAILATGEMPLNGTETGGSLHDAMKDVSAQVLAQTLPAYIAGKIQPQKQDESKATWCSLISKEDGRIDWNASSSAIDAHVRAYTPWPGTFTEYNGKRIMITKTALTEEGELSILRVKPAGKKEMDYADFQRGYKIILEK